MGKPEKLEEVDNRVSRDNTTVGNITNAKGVAIGSGSTVIINENLPQPILFLLGGVLFVVIIIAGVMLWRESPSREIPPLKLSTPIMSFTMENGDYLGDVIAQDENIWLATENGLFQLDEQFQKHSFLEGENITALAETNDKHLWIGTETGYIGRVDTTNPTAKITSIDSQKTSTVMVIAVDQEDHMWVAYWEDSIVRYAPNGVTKAIEIPLPDNHYMYDLTVHMVNGQEILWAITVDGLYRWKDGQWGAKFDKNAGLPEVILRKLVVDDFGGHWFAHNEGVTYVSSPELANWSDVFSNAVTCTPESGQLPLDSIEGMSLDNGWLWLGSPQGIARKEIIADEADEPCANWQIYVPELESNYVSAFLMEMDVRDKRCEVWLAETSDLQFYRLIFGDAKGCER